MHLIFLSYQPVTALQVTVLRWELKGFWQFYHMPFYSQRLLILKLVLCFKSGIYRLTVRPSAAHRGLRWGTHYGIRTVKHWNRSSLSPAAVAVASSFSKLLILLLAHLEALPPSGKSNPTVHATRLVADDRWHSWETGQGLTPQSRLLETWGWSFLQSEWDSVSDLLWALFFLSFFLFFFKILFIYIGARGRQGEREGEKHQCVTDTSIHCLLHTLNGGPGP